jgi:hypothetical protein
MFVMCNNNHTCKTVAHAASKVHRSELNKQALVTYGRLYANTVDDNMIMTSKLTQMHYQSRLNWALYHVLEMKAMHVEYISLSNFWVCVWNIASIVNNGKRPMIVRVLFLRSQRIKKFRVFSVVRMLIMLRSEEPVLHHSPSQIQSNSRTYGLQ